MTLQQLSYLQTVIRLGSFAKAAQALKLTQPTLSMQIQKLEEAAGMVLLDRGKRPVTATAAASQFIEQAYQVLHEYHLLENIVQSFNETISGNIKIGIIPTIAPYLMPYFAGKFSNKYPEAMLQFEEITTSAMVEELKNETLDCGILAGPLNQKEIAEIALYNESFLVYANKDSTVAKKKNVAIRDLQKERIWLLKEGHCLRDQVLQLCKLNKQNKQMPFQFNAGSMETLISMVNMHGGITLIPAMAELYLRNSSIAKCLQFQHPIPARKIVLVFNKTNARRKIIPAIHELIMDNLPGEIRNQKSDNILRIDIS